MPASEPSRQSNQRKSVEELITEAHVEVLNAELAERGITLEVCPTSNVRTGVVPSLEAHPLPDLLRAGVPVTLGSDDPTYFDTDLVREMQAVHERLGLDLDTLDAIVDSGARAAFLPPAECAALAASLGKERTELRRSLGLARAG